MSLTQRLEAWLDANVWRFFRGIITANHDYPYHDSVFLDNVTGQEPLTGVYVVGSSNVNCHGDQSKLFVSKHANITSNGPGLVTLQFNDSRNAVIILPISVFDSTDQIFSFEKEFFTNISSVYYSIPIGVSLAMYFEGVLPQEARDAE